MENLQGKHGYLLDATLLELNATLCLYKRVSFC